MPTDNAVPTAPDLALTVNGEPVAVPDDGSTLLSVLRDRLGLRSVKDGCSPQGQCGCCTVLVDGQPRVSCVTPARRVRDRTITTLEGFAAAERSSWGDAFCATGASQCGFCTPGIIVRLAGLAAKDTAVDDAEAVERSLQAHLCRCTGWQTIVDAWTLHQGAAETGVAIAVGDRSFDAAARRAEIEGGVAQTVSREVALGEGGFADDGAPVDALIAVRSVGDEWVVGETIAEARRLAGKVQGRRTTVDTQPPLDLPVGDWVRTLRTSWVDPGYLETDASWCAPGGEPASALGNGGAFGAKETSQAAAIARRLADEHGRPVRVLYSREDAIRLGPKRPPIAAGIAADGTGVVRVARTPGIAAAITAVAPGLVVEEVDLPGPPTSVALRGAGWAEAAILLAGLAEAPAAGDPGATATITAPGGGTARATYDGSTIAVSVRCGDPLDEVVLRSYCIGAAHMGFSWVTSEGLAIDADGEIGDLTVRSLRIARAIDTPPIEITIEPVAPNGPPETEVCIDDPDSTTPGAATGPVNGSDAVFAAVAAAVWGHLGYPPAWPTGI